MIELLVVVAIIAIMIAISLLSMPSQKRGLAVDAASAQLVDVFRYAQQQALAERHVMRVELTPGTTSVPGTIQVINQMRISLGAADDRIVRNETLPPNSDSTVATTLAGFPMPPTPFNFLAPTFTAGKLTVYFMPDGTAVRNPNEDPAVPRSFTLVHYTPISPGVPAPDLVRAITLFGPTASARIWIYNPATSNFQEP